MIFPGLRSIDWAKVSYVFKGMLVGLISGTVVSVFRIVVEGLIQMMPGIYAFLRENPLWLIGWAIFVLFLGAIVSRMVYAEPRIAGNGVSEIKGQLFGLFRLNWVSVLVRKFLGSSIVIGLGLPVGREGPALQIGGVTAQGVNHFLKGSKSQENILTSSGVAAGLSAAFNTPLSGLVIVLEEIHHRFSSILVLSVFSASLVASFIAFQVFGTEPAIALAPVESFPLGNYGYLAFFGIILAVLGRLFQKMSFGMGPAVYSKLPIPRYIIMLIPFVLVIFIGLFWEDMLGGGTGLIQDFANQRHLTQFLLAVLVFRVLAFVVSFGTGIPAGMLVPLLTVGGIIGAIYGNFVLNITGLEDVFISNFVIYGMAGFMAVVNKAPLTAIVLAAELTGSITQMMSISVVALSAFIVAEIINVQPADEITLKSITTNIPKVFKGKLESVTVFVEPGGLIDGAPLKEFSFPYNAQIVSVRRHNNEFLPHSNTIFFSGDELTISCDSGFLKELNKYIDKIN